MGEWQTRARGGLQALLLAVGCLAGAGHTQTAPQPALTGTFIQPTAETSNWHQNDWSTLFEHFRQLRLKHIVVQWTAFDDQVFFDSETYRAVPNPPLEHILRLADELNMDVLVGLAHHSEYWDKIKRPPALLEVYFGRRRVAAQALIRELAAQLRKHPSFAGWYLCDEIDDVNWRTPERRSVLHAYLRGLTDDIRRVDTKGKVAISGFSNAALSPGGLAAFWDELLRAASIDILLFQDGVGAEKLQLTELPIYLDALQPLFQDNPRELRVVVELFQQIPAADGEFRAVPAPLERISRQLHVASRYTTRPMAFSVPDYMNPSHGAEQTSLFNSYLRNLEPAP